MDGDFVKNSAGKGTAQVWGINFDVADPVGVSAGSHIEGTISSDFDQSDVWNEITLGDDVKIRLEKVPGNTITFKLNGKVLGTIEVGDIVVIDKKRNVMVNGTIRQPESTAP